MFRKLMIAASCLALLALPLLVESQWGGPRGCIVAAQETVASKGYEWKEYPSHPNQAYLILNGKQVGGWDATTQKYRFITDWNRNLWSEPQDKAPIDPPAHLVRPIDGVKMPEPPPVEKKEAEKKDVKLEPFMLTGVNAEEVSKHETFSINGVPVAQSTLMNSIGKVELEDDSGRLRLSVWSKDPAKRAAVIEVMKSDPEFWKFVTERCHLWAGQAANPDHFLAKDRDGQPLYAFDGDPLVMLQDPSGVELWHDAGFTGGPASFQDMRKRDPLYRPDRTPGPKNPKSPNPTDETDYTPVALLGAAFLALLAFGRKPQS